jgi:mitogen-activated protein kinase kinase kinase 4
MTQLNSVKCMFLFCIKYHRELTRLVSGDARNKMSSALVEFANQWMKFVAKKCERGRGLRPRY